MSRRASLSNRRLVVRSSGNFQSGASRRKEKYPLGRDPTGPIVAREWSVSSRPSRCFGVRAGEPDASRAAPCRPTPAWTLQWRRFAPSMTRRRGCSRRSATRSSACTPRSTRCAERVPACRRTTRHPGTGRRPFASARRTPRGARRASRTTPAPTRTRRSIVARSASRRCRRVLPSYPPALLPDRVPRARPVRDEIVPPPPGARL